MPMISLILANQILLGAGFVSMLIAKMPSKGYSPDKVSYCTVMGFFYKDRKVEEVKRLMENMVRNSDLIPYQITYNTLIHALSKHGHAGLTKIFNASTICRFDKGSWLLPVSLIPLTKVLRLSLSTSVIAQTTTESE
ncbi:unnamed protein product [Lathyrus sativus]|nr:unnamed protein product [Lathyrus sativus]